MRAGAEVVATERTPLRFEFQTPPAVGSLTPVAPGILWLRLPLPMVLNHINVWLLEAADGWMLVDTGIGADDVRDIWRTVGSSLFANKPLRRIFVTHYHPDHVGLAGWLAGEFGAEVWMSASCQAAMELIFAVAASGSNPQEMEFLAAHGLADADELRDWVLGSDYARWVGVMVKVTHCPRAGERLQWGDGQWHISEHGGHAEGQLCLHDPRRPVLISGDQVLPEISPNISLGGSAPDPDPLATFLESLDRLDLMAPDTLVLPSHGLPFRGLGLRIADLRRHHERQLAKIGMACATPTSAAEVARRVFPRATAGLNRLLALGETVAHLEFLARRGRIVRHIDGAGRIHYGAGGAERATGPESPL